MSGWQQNAKLFAKCAEVVAAGGGHEHGGEFVGIECLLVFEESRLA